MAEYISIKMIFDFFGLNTIILYNNIFTYNGYDAVPEAVLDHIVQIEHIYAIYEGDKIIGSFVDCKICPGNSKPIIINKLSDLISILPNMYRKEVLLTRKSTITLENNKYSINTTETGDMKSIMHVHGNDILSYDISIIMSDSMKIHITYTPYME